MRYSIVIPTYNRCEDLLKPCLESIFKYTDMTDVELIISANGCKDSTDDYLKALKEQFVSIGFDEHLKVVWSEAPLGYAGATNAGIAASTADKIVLLNNDVILLPQAKSQWLHMLDEPLNNPKCGISGALRLFSEVTQREFIVFFCAMIRRQVFSHIGLLDIGFGVGGSEDIDFCARAEKAGWDISECFPKTWDGVQWVNCFPMYHKGEATMHDPGLVQNWSQIFARNTLKLAKQHNLDWYRWKLSNNYERAVFLKGDEVFPREKQRYQWAAKHMIGTKVLEIGCSTGYGVQFMSQGVHYTGLDYDPVIVEVAQEQGWSANAQFVHADINKIELDQYDTIIAFEVIEHLDNGLEVLQKLKNQCKTLLFTVPWNEPPGFWGEHHKLHGLNESHFPGFEFNYIDEHGNITDRVRTINEQNRFNLMIGYWRA